MSGSTIISLIAIITAAIAPMVTIFSNREVNKAKARIINIGGEKTLVEMYQEYAADVKKQLEDQCLKTEEVSKKLDELSLKFDGLVKEKEQSDIIIARLQSVVKDLTVRLSKYESVEPITV